MHKRSRSVSRKISPNNIATPEEMELTETKTFGAQETIAANFYIYRETLMIALKNRLASSNASSTTRRLYHLGYILDSFRDEKIIRITRDSPTFSFNLFYQSVFKESVRFASIVIFE